MVSRETQSVIARAKQLYETNLRESLEQSHKNQYVAIEPDSGQFCVADTFDDAVKLVRALSPGKVSHTIRIGHVAAFHDRLPH